MKLNKLKKRLLIATLASTVPIGGALAQDEGEDKDAIEAIVVTGSHIRGTPEDAALPVDVISRVDLDQIGSPSLVELVRNMGVSSGADGETNQFSSNGLEGTANVNLRGLGPGRTLVLINGSRQVLSPYSIGEQAQLFVDINQIPSVAIGRVEVLKDGAAATYGSDAIAGVVNFITRSNFSGWEVSGSYQAIDGSDGDYNLGLSYGLQDDNTSWVTSFGYNVRNELTMTERDWALRPYADNPQGGWSSIGNPGSFVTPSLAGWGIANFGTPLAAAQSDPNCALLGGTDAGVLCRFQYTQFDNLIEETERFQVFSEINHSFSNGMDLHLEGLYAFTDVPEWKTSPSYPPQALFGQVMLPSHPGLVDMFANYPAFATAFGGGAEPLIFFGRTFGNGGAPGLGAQQGDRMHQTSRLAGNVKGDWGSTSYEFAVSYSKAQGERNTPDTYVRRLEWALAGIGGDGCVAADFDNPLSPANDPFRGVGNCAYYNPFSNAIETSAVNGASNPDYEPSLANSPEMLDWLTDMVGTEVISDLFVADLVFSGDTSMELGGGIVGWAAGAQFRKESYKVTPNNVTDLTIYPCLDAGDFSCASPTGPFAFLAGTLPFDDDRDVWAAFFELALPFSETFDAQLAARFEDYGGATGSTFDPKVAVRWQVSDIFAVRGSAQTTFRGPTLNQLGGQATTLQYIAPTGAFKAVDTFGNPDLAPESAFNFNFGLLLDTGNFRGSIDYWNFDFEDPIIVEPQTAIVNAALAAAASATPATHPMFPIMDARVTFDGAPGPSTLSRVRVGVVNGPDIKTSGIDISGELVVEDSVLGGELAFGVDASYILEYEVGAVSVEGIEVQAAFDGVGQMNRSNFLRSMPQWKGSLNGSWTLDNHNVRAIVRYTDSYDDERFSVGVDSWTTLDLHYNLELPGNATLSVSIFNTTDEDPPFARLDLNYDPYSHSPFGRMWKIGLTKRFGG